MVISSTPSWYRSLIRKRARDRMLEERLAPQTVGDILRVLGQALGGRRHSALSPLRSTFMALGPRIERAEGLLFEGEEQVLHLIERIVAPLGLRVDESSPYVDARLQDGSRVNTKFSRAPFAARCDNAETESAADGAAWN
jgi:Flp pilus assembly CpaF family ATPase